VIEWFLTIKEIPMHTPGPWTVELPYGEPGVYITAADPRRTNPLICKLIDQAQAPEGKANALLIAAAPSLLNMLQRMVDETNGGGKPCLCTLEHAKNAIKKAKTTK
jgi:hypothetical protein